MVKKVLFVRHFTRLFGGHIRHWHYWQHVKKAPGYEPTLLFKGNFGRADNPWRNEKPIARLDWGQVDILILGGMFWNMVSNVPSHIPIINLIQGVQHIEAPRNEFLKRRAIRICMSSQIRDIVKSRANGPIFTVNPSVDTPIVRSGKRDIGVLVIGHKRKPLARKIGRALPQARILTQFIPRQDLFALMRRSKIVVGLPKRREGFYLPALEAMCSGALVICPDCIGNRELCTDRYNCLQPIYSSGYIIETIKQALALPDVERRRILAGGLETAKRNRPAREYKQFARILGRAEELWRN
jgi:hypothetical protein